MLAAQTPALLTTEQAAAIVGEPSWLLRVWQALHDGPLVVRVGTAILYRLRDLKAWVAAGKPLLHLSSRIAGRSGRDNSGPVRVSEERQRVIASGM